MSNGDGPREGSTEGTTATNIDPAVGRIVADADVLAADLFLDGPARAALDLIRGHSWLELVASDALLADAECIIATVADERLATDWRSLMTDLVTIVSHPADDHPALAAALHGDARHVLSTEPTLLTAGAGLAIRDRAETSVKRPEAFVRLADPATLHAVVVGGE
ncbi:MAG: hypothetical protein R3324_06995, partial [Halobacteriales archaeon]|nr:hypothetical protein [Halobacteriales archaeon]